MNTDTTQKCAYFTKFTQPIASRLDIQLVTAGIRPCYANIYLSDNFLTDYLWEFCEKNGGFVRILSAEKSDIYICHIFTYALKSFGRQIVKENSANLSPLEHKLATMLYCHIQNPSDNTRDIVSLRIFEYFRSLTLTKMSSLTQLLLMSCVLIYL